MLRTYNVWSRINISEVVLNYNITSRIDKNNISYTFTSKFDQPINVFFTKHYGISKYFSSFFKQFSVIKESKMQLITSIIYLITWVFMLINILLNK